LRFPEAAIVLDPRGSVFHRCGNETATVDAAGLLAREQAGAFEHAQVLGNGWQ
jgi:hypothetical protein